MNLRMIETAAQHASHAVDQGHRAAHRLRTAAVWEGRNHAQRDDHVAEARVLLHQMSDAIAAALAALEEPSAPPVPPAIAARADLVAVAFDIAKRGAAA